MNLIEYFSNILIHFLYGDNVTLEIYQSQLIEFVAIVVCLVLGFLVVRFILSIFTLFRKY